MIADLVAEAVAITLVVSSFSEVAELEVGLPDEIELVVTLPVWMLEVVSFAEELAEEVLVVADFSEAVLLVVGFSEEAEVVLTVVLVVVEVILVDVGAEEVVLGGSPHTYWTASTALCKKDLPPSTLFMACVASQRETPPKFLWVLYSQTSSFKALGTM